MEGKDIVVTRIIMGRIWEGLWLMEGNYTMIRLRLNKIM